MLSSTAYRYDALGRRIAAGDRSYFYDGEHIILSFRKTSLSDYADIQFYTHSDVTDDVVALTGQDPSVTPFFASNLRPDTASAYYHTDHQGLVRAITDDSGAAFITVAPSVHLPMIHLIICQ